MHIVIIEDVPDHLEVMRVMLEGPFNVSTFASAAEALVALEWLRPDVFLIDIGMGGIDGIECLRRIRAMPMLGNTPAIAVTAFAYPQDKQRCLDAGFQGFVAKPVSDFESLKKLIRETAGRLQGRGA